ncbi:MAG: hypothetical protein AAGB32_01115 [Pseudomonadota bacterium]
MLNDQHKADVAYRILYTIQSLCEDEDQGTDAMKAITILSGVYVETAFLFDNCDEALQGSFSKLANRLQCEPQAGEMGDKALPPASIIDCDAEMGRMIAREFFEEWLDCGYEFHNFLIEVTQQLFSLFEGQQTQYSIAHNIFMGQRKAESFRLLVETTYRAMAYELAAQELCDVVIEKKIGINGWNMADSVSGLAGMAGRKLSLSHDGRNQCCWFRGTDLPDLLDQTAYVMTQEAVRLGTPTGTDWRFGLPANDTPANAPTLLVNSVEAICEDFFKIMQLFDYHDQAVCAAKAAGRMLAVACAGERPDLEPAIAKPLAMAAMTETYKNACVEYAAVSY